MPVPKKSLGQHWLQSPVMLEAIVKAAGNIKDKTVLEIGPGQGTLTEKLLAVGATVIAIEKDDRLIEVLETTFAAAIAAGKLRLIHQDILTTDLTALNLTPQSYTVVANIPYYITGHLLRRLLEEGPQPTKMVLVTQKEVAERIARSKKESLLSISVKAYGQPRYIKTIGRSYFKPQPKVDSAIILIENISRTFFTDCNQSAFFALLKKGFGQKRKMLRGTLGYPPAVFTQSDLSPTARAEELSVLDWKKLLLTHDQLS